MEYFYQLPGYRNFVGMEPIILYAKFKPGFKKDKMYCGSFELSKNKGIGSETETFENLRLANNVIVFIFCSLLTLGFLGAILFSCFAGKTSLFFQTIFIFAGISFLYSLINTILCGVATIYSGKINENSQLLIDLGEANCFINDSYNRLFYNMEIYLKNGFNDSVDYNNINLIISSCTLGLTIIFAVGTFIIQ